MNSQKIEFIMYLDHLQKSWSDPKDLEFVDWLNCNFYIGQD